MNNDGTACGSFARTASYVLYGHALKECFVNVVWTSQGFFVFAAVTTTVVRYFLANVLMDSGGKFSWNKLSQFSGVWLCILLAGLSALAARYQGDNRLLYVIPALAMTDILWTMRACVASNNGGRFAGRSAMRSRIAIDVVMAGFVLSSVSLIGSPISVTDPLSPDVARVVVAGLLLAGVVDLLLNSRLYWLD